MKKSIYIKLAIAFMLVAVLTSGMIALFIRITSADRLYRLVLDQQSTSLEQSAANYYITSGTWDGINQVWYEFQRRTDGPSFTTSDNRPPGNLPAEFEHRNLFGLVDANGVVVVPIDPYTQAGTVISSSELDSGTPIMVNGTRVGTILTVKRLPLYNPAETLFLQRTNQGLIYAMLGALGVALVLGLLFARSFARPLQELTRAARNMAHGELEQKVMVTSKDEIGQLALAFNQMSTEVASANQQRRQMTADIAHDLRTPLTVIAGYVESMRDGVLKPTPERLTVIYTEIERLQQMVNDLRMLSQADAGDLHLNRQPVAPNQLLERATGLFQHHADRQQVQLAIQVDQGLPDILVDDSRMMQVLDNLISNALHYTPEGGRITLGGQAKDGKVELTVEDTGSGIPEEEIPLIFNRFHRVEKSRHAESGESGLGLAIVKALVEANGGQVWAESLEGHGTTMHLSFPAESK
jgi:two-component system, OmpR family, sensor histidine kinase BaeS